MLQHGRYCIDALRLVRQKRAPDQLLRVTGGHAAQQCDPLGNAIQARVHLLVALLKEAVQFHVVFSLDQPVMLVILVIEHPERSLEGVQMREQLLDHRSGQSHRVHAHLRARPHRLTKDLR